MNIVQATRRALSREALVLRKNSPHIFFVVGVAGVIGGTILACRATLKLEKTLEDCKEDIELTKDTHKDNATLDRAIAISYVKNSAKIVKLYAPSATVMTLSLAALTNSHVTLARRNTALMSAYALVSKAYENYRDRVREEFGEEKELELYHAVKKELSADGKTELALADPTKFSPYARFFDEGSPSWVKDPELNRLFVQCQQQYANHLLHGRGHVMLNEVYDMLGIDRSKAGFVVGWILKNGNENYIDFGIFQARNAQFVNGWERNILLDFNVDGVIFDKI